MAIRYLTGDDLDAFYELWNRTWETEDSLYLEVLCPHSDFKHDGPSNSVSVPGKTDDTDASICSPPFYIGLHKVCQRPLPASISGLVKECDSCEEFYLSRQWPDRNFLCAYCSGDTA